MKIQARVSEYKRKEVEEICRLIDGYKVMGIVNLEKLPAFNYMKIKYGLRDKVKIKYTKKRLISIAFDIKKDERLSKLKNRLMGIPALIFTNEEPFKLAQILKKSQSNAPAKSGDIVPKDIIISAGPTEFTPGPIIGELGSFGIKTRVEGGKISIISDKLLVKAGEKINEKNASLMSKLKMEPMKIGLNLVLTYENGEVYEGSVLNINLEDYENNIRIAAMESFNLALQISYLTKETIGFLISKAAREGDYLAEKIKFSDIEEQFKHKTSISEEKKDVEKEIKKRIDIVSGISNIDDEMIKKAQDTLKELTTKKIKGEI